MVTNIVIPSDLWEEDLQAVITTWLVDDGATVGKGDLIAEIMTAKVQNEIHAPAAGKVHIVQKADAVVSKGDVIGWVG